MARFSGFALLRPCHLLWYLWLSENTLFCSRMSHKWPQLRLIDIHPNGGYPIAFIQLIVLVSRRVLPVMALGGLSEKNAQSIKRHMARSQSRGLGTARTVAWGAIREVPLRDTSWTSYATDCVMRLHSGSASAPRCRILGEQTHPLIRLYSFFSLSVSEAS